MSMRHAAGGGTLAGPGGASGAGGTIYDRGYRHYDGPREGRSRPVRAILWTGVRRVLGIKRSWKTKVVPFGLLVLAFAPALVFVAIRVIAGPAAGEFTGYPDFLGVTAVALLLFAGTAGPELLCPDRREGTLALVFSRPITLRDYLAGKLGALLVLTALIAIVPALVLFLGNLFTDDSAWGYLRTHWGDLLRILAVGGVLTVFYALTSLGVASTTDRRGIATAVFLGVFLASSAMANLLFAAPGIPGRRWLALLSLQGLPGNVTSWVFGKPFTEGSMAAQAGFTGPAYLAALAVLAALGALLLVNRLRKVTP